MKKGKKTRDKETIWPCQQCGDCCSVISFDINFFEKNRDKIHHNIIREEIGSSPDGTPLIMPLTDDGRCVFLRKDFKCDIYDDKPEICRQFGLRGGVLECHRVTPNGRIRSPEEVKRKLKKLQELEKKGQDMFADRFGIKYIPPTED